MEEIFMSFCPKCGKQLAEGAKFCTGCGNAVAAAAAPAAAPQQPVSTQPAPQQPAPQQPAYTQPTLQQPVYQSAPQQPVYAQSAPVAKKKTNWTVAIILILVGLLIIGAGVAVIADIADDGEFNLFGLLDSEPQNDDDEDEDDETEGDEDPDATDDENPDPTGDNDATDPSGNQGTVESQPEATQPEATQPEETRPVDSTNPPAAATEQTEPVVAAPAIVGTWVGQIDMAPMMNSAMGSDEAVLQYIRIDEFLITTTFTFDESGWCTMTMDENDFNTGKENCAATWKEGFTRMIEDLIAANGLDMTVDEYAQAALGMSVNDYVDLVMQSMNLDSSSFSSSGGYLYENSNLYVEGMDGYFVVNLMDDRMILEEYVGSDEDGQMYSALLVGIVFERN